jgi:uncharacterized membrane protein YfcA
MSPEAITLELALLVILATAAAYVVKGATGFGPALIFVPVVTIALGPKIALASSAVIDLVSGLLLVTTVQYKKAELALAIRMIVAMVIGAGIGALAAGLVPVEVLSSLIALLAVLIGLDLVLRNRRELTPVELLHSKNVMGASFAGGVSGGLTGISGPFVVGATSSLEKSSFRRILILVFTAEQPVKILAYIAVGIWSQTALLVALACAPAVILGLMVGTKLHHRLTGRVFATIVGGLILVSGAVLLGEGLFS